MLRRRLAAKRFRGSIARCLISLSTLRRGSRLPATQDSLPAAGPALPDGIGYPQGSLQKVSSLWLSSFPELLGAMRVLLAIKTRLGQDFDGDLGEIIKPWVVGYQNIAPEF